MLRAATSCTILACLKTFAASPAKLLHSVVLSLPARLVFAVYFGTYTTANSVDTMTSFFASSPPTTVTAGTTKFLGTAAISTALTVYKDSRMAQYFGRQSLSASVPLLTCALFTARDAITIYASFNLPTMLAPRLADLPENVKARLGRIVQTESARLKTAQFMLPAAIQFLTTPIHLLGLDHHNRRGNLGYAARFHRVARDFSIAVPVRMMRIVPAFGVGGVINASSRRRLMEAL